MEILIVESDFAIGISFTRRVALEAEHVTPVPAHKRKKNMAVVRVLVGLGFY
jgi:hypothetical protein